METDTEAPEAPETPEAPAAHDIAATSIAPVAHDDAGKIPFSTFAHELIAKHQRPMVAALRVTMKIRKGDVTTTMFTRDELQKALDTLLGGKDDTEATH